MVSCSNSSGQCGKGERGGRESGVVELVPKTREGVWVIGCASPVMPLMGMLNYKDKLFDK